MPGPAAPPYPDHPHPTDPAAPGRLPRQRQPALPVYSDLLAPAPPAAAGHASASGYPPAPAPAGYGPAGPPPELPPPPPLPGGAPTGYLPPPQRSAAGSPISPAGAVGVAGTEPGEEAPERTGLPVGVIVGLVLIGATVLVLGALSIPFLLDRLDDSGSFAVGDCVVQDSGSPRTVDCSEPEAFQIVAEVDNQEQCADPTQPAIEVPGPPAQFYCLAPVAGPPAAPTGPPTE